MALEWAKLTTPDSKGLGPLLAALTAIVIVWAHLRTPEITTSLSILVPVILLGALMIRFNMLKTVGWWLVGVGYVAAPMLALAWLRDLDHGLLVLWVFFIVWATDIGGYFFGKAIGGPKLAPKLSPKKTWAGLLGGMAFSIAVGLLLHFVFGLVGGLFVIVIASGLLAAWAQAGDLLESGIKRHFGVKDSGGLIPGHGGLLDRVDGLVFVAPAVALLLACFPSIFGGGA